MNRWIICVACGGEGTCVNPDIDSNGLIAEDFYDDPDFREDYLSGVYDVRCAACNGTGKIRESHLNTLQQNAAERRLAAMENGDFEAYCGAGDYRYG